MRNGDATNERRNPGLYEAHGASGDNEEEEVENLVPDGKRVIGSVGGVEAISGGFIDCTPADMQIDSGAVASLVGSRELKRIGRSDQPLRPYQNALNGVTGHKVRIQGCPCGWVHGRG